MDGEIFDSGKKKLRIQKYPDACGRGLKKKQTNKNVCFRKKLLRLVTSFLMLSVNALNTNPSPKEHFSLLNIVNAIHLEWRQSHQTKRTAPSHIHKLNVINYHLPSIWCTSPPNTILCSNLSIQFTVCLAAFDSFTWETFDNRPVSTVLYSFF